MKKHDKDIIYEGYKEPLKRFHSDEVNDGYGYYGVVAFHRKTGKVQCHFCGEFFERITANHTQKHGLFTTREYKQLTGLSMSTVLCSERYRQKMIAKYDKKYIKKPNVKNVIAANKKRKGDKLSIEARNKRGNCPEQLLKKIKDLHYELGHTPSKREFMHKHKGKFMDLIYRTHGSYDNAVHLAGLISKKTRRKIKYSWDSLLEYMRLFYKNNNRLPKKSDFKKGLLPSYSTYIKKFGSIYKARELAFQEHIKIGT